MEEEYDFILTVTGRELEPYVRRGGLVRGVRTSRLRDGEVGVFLLGERALVRQFCEDSEGNIYLFTVNRELTDDISVKKGEGPVCFARLLLPEIPLPSSFEAKKCRKNRNENDRVQEKLLDSLTNKR